MNLPNFQPEQAWRMVLEQLQDEAAVGAIDTHNGAVDTHTHGASDTHNGATGTV
jgi:hypothetical protein